jgi:putative ABC transport system permease protein
MSLFRVAARNLFRNKFRTIFTVLGGAVAVLVFITLQTVLTAWYVAAEHSAKDRIATRHKVSFIMQLPKRYVDTVREVGGVKEATWANWFGGKNPKDPDNFFATFGVDAKTFFTVYDEMVVPSDQLQSWQENRRGAIVGDVLARKLGVGVGDRVTLSGTIYPGDWEFQVSGIYTATRKSVDRSQFVFHWDYMNESLPERARDRIGWIVARIDDPSRSADITAAIDGIFDTKDIQTATMSERALNLSFMAMLSAILTALNVVSAIIMVIMALIVGNTIAMGVRERTHEYGVLRAVGFTATHVRNLVVGEALVTGLVTAIVGVGIAYPLVQLMLGRYLEENMGAWFPYFRIDAVTVALAAGLAMALAVAASAIPAWSASRIRVTDALRRIA